MLRSGNVEKMKKITNQMYSNRDAMKQRIQASYLSLSEDVIC